MAPRVGLRQEQRVASEAAILEAAWSLFASRGPAAVSIREVAAAAGCTHPLVTRYFGSKEDLVGAVATRLATHVDAQVGQRAGDPLSGLLDLARADRPTARLLVRTALGDLPPRGFPACLHAEDLLAASATSPTADRRSRLCAYAAACTVVGAFTFEGFLVAGTGLGRWSPRRRDRGFAGAARAVLERRDRPEPRLGARDLPAVHVAAPEAAGSRQEALLTAAVALFAERGPAATSVRDIAARAGANQGLIYRHFGSKDALLAAAIEQALSDLFPAALRGPGVDFDALSWLLHHASAGPRVVARTLVDDVDITSVRRRYPVLHRMIGTYGGAPSGVGPGDLSDPRLAVCAAAAMALGSAVWGDHLRPALGLGPRDGVESAVADLAAVIVGAPRRGRAGRSPVATA